ncbi:c-type cytochrome [Aurantivibrio plasticivorans]
MQRSKLNILIGLCFFVGFIPDLATAEQARSPQTIFDTFCFSCHGTGWENAPVLGDSFAWEGRKEQGMAVLLQHTLEGFGGMPIKGGCADCTEEELKATIEWMSAE